MSAAARVRSVLVLLLVVTFAVYLPVLRNGFVWDDRQYVLANPHVTGGLTAESVRWAFTAFEAGNWHPLTWLTHMLDVALFGLAPQGPHLVNVLLHGANTLLVFLLLARATGAAWRSLLVAALFALHPLHVESVAWIAERKDVLSTCLGLLTALAYLAYLRRPGAPRYLVTLGLFVAALAAKPMLVTLPLLLLLFDVWPFGRLQAGGWRRPVLEKLPLLVLSLASSAVTWLAQESSGAHSTLTLAVRLSNTAVSYVRYLGKIVAPTRLAAIYPHPLAAWPPLQTTGALLLLGAATALVLLAWRRRPWLAVGWLWFLGTLVPVIGIVQVGLQAMADRYTYFPSLGLFLAAVWGGGELAARRASWRAALLVAVAGALAACSALTVVQTGAWRNDVVLFRHAAAVVPGNWVAHYNLGALYQELGWDDEAIGQYRAAIAARPPYVKALINLSMLLGARGEYAEVESLLREAIRASPDSVLAYNNLGAEYQRQKRYHEAEAYYLKACELDPAAVEPRLNLGSLMLATERWTEAETWLAAALRLQPDDADARNNFGIALARQQRYGEAAAAFRESLRLDPGNRETAANLAQALARIGRRTAD